MRKLLTALGCAAVVAACGGGGGGSDDPSPERTYDLAAAQLAFLTGNYSWTVRGEGPNDTEIVAVLSVEPASDAEFRLTGETAQRSIAHIRITADGEELADSESDVFFDAATGVQLGSVDADGSCARVDKYTVLPSDAPADYESAADAERVSEISTCDPESDPDLTFTTKWYVDVDGDIAYLCSDSTHVLDNGNFDGREVQCIQVHPDGTLGTRAKFRLEYPDLDPIVLTN